MYNRSGGRRPHLVLASLLLFSLHLQAEPVPSQDFWNYLNDFSDDNAELVDPQDVDDVLGSKENSDDLSEQTGDQDSTASQSPAHWQTGSDEAKKSSRQASSAISRAKL